ncbi:hypothetical protein Tco_0775696 [Tanacetum coccineum]
MENTQSRNPNITNSTSSDMENTHSVFDAKVTIRGTLHTLTSIKELLGQSVNERRRTRFLSTVFGKWLDFPAYSNDNLLLNYIFQHEVKQEQNNDVCPPIRYKIGNNNFEFGRQEFCLITGFAFGKIPKEDTFKGLQNSPFCDRSALSDEDSVKKNPLVIPRGLAWLKIGNFEKGDYGALFAEWSNPILCMAPTSTELLQSWLIRSMDYFRTLLVDGQPNGPITASPEGIQPIICAAVVHDPQFEQQPKEVVESVPLFTSEELVAKYHSITTTVQLIKNVGDGDPSIILKELADVKQRMNAIERFIKSRNDNLSEDSVAKQSVEKEIESSDGKADSAISNVLIGEISCQNLVQEQLQSRDMCIQSITNQIVQHPLESPKGNSRH